MFADDTNVFMSRKDLKYFRYVKLGDGQTVNLVLKFKINHKKTKFMVFKPRRKCSICNIQASIDNQNIVKVKEINFLGVILDENLGGRKYHMLQIKLWS